MLYQDERQGILLSQNPLFLFPHGVPGNLQDHLWCKALSHSFSATGCELNIQVIAVLLYIHRIFFLQNLQSAIYSNQNNAAAPDVSSDTRGCAKYKVLLLPIV